MRNVIYDPYSDSGYACAECGEPITPEEMFADTWHCGHQAIVKDAAHPTATEVVAAMPSFKTELHYQNMPLMTAKEETK